MPASATESIPTDSLDPPVRAPARRHRRAKRIIPTWLIGIVFVGGYLLTGLVWSFSAALGAGPDDDYHMVSLWCPPPLEESGCTIGFDAEKNRRTVQAPQQLSAAACYAFDPNKSAACQDSNDPSAIVPTHRVDDGDYPGWYYRIMHVFMGTDPARSMLMVRLANVLIATGFLAAIFALLGPAGRRLQVTQIVATASPITIAFVASVNPSSWAITGSLGTWLAFLAMFTATSRWRQVTAGVVGVAAAALACAARADSAAYVCVIAFACAVLFLPKLLRQLWLLVPLGVASLLGLATFFTSGQNSALAGGFTSNTDLSGLALLAKNILELPSLLAGTFGIGWPLGWFDTPLPAVATFGGFLAALIVVVVGLGRMFWMKAVATGTVALIVVAMPLLALQLSGVLVGREVQPRYILPLLLTGIGVVGVMSTRGETLTLSKTQAGAIWMLVAAANSVALHTVINRYTTGLDITGLNPGLKAEWWWPVGPSPMTMWLLGSLTGAIFATAVWLIHWRVPTPALVDPALAEPLLPKLALPKPVPPKPALPEPVPAEPAPNHLAAAPPRKEHHADS